MRFILHLVAGLLICSNAVALSLDDRLRHIIETFEIKPASCGPVDQRAQNDKLVELGEFFFTSKLLSGGSDTSCSTCHLDDKHLTDGLPVAVGVGGEGEGIARMDSGGVIVPRNAFTLFGRAHPNYNTFFWDGKVIAQDGLIYSPIGEGYSKGFKSPLSVAAVLPILARDEFLGEQRMFSGTRNLELINTAYFDDKFIAANKLIDEMLTSEHEDAGKLEQLKQNAGLESLDLAVVGNSLAAFIVKKSTEQCEMSAWDRYLTGNTDSLSDRQKEGAVLFFGKGRCAACHSGDLMSDMQFHSIGVPQGEFGTHIHKQDLGRAEITFNDEDRYKFRTPPLIGVSQTAPYGHNGVFDTLEEAVLFHANPIPFFIEKRWTSEREMLTYGKLLGARSDILGYIDLKSQEELAALIEYLKSL